MKKLFFVFMFLVVISSVQALTIYDYLDNIIKTNNTDNVIVVIGEGGTGQDVIAAQTIMGGFQKLTKAKGLMDYKLDTETDREINLMLLGNPCDNTKITDLGLLECSDQLYVGGEAYIKVSGTNLLIAGATGKDTRGTAEIIANYRNYQSLLNTGEVIINPGTGTETENEGDCGDGICEPGESLFCSQDCIGHISCEDYCVSANYVSGICRTPVEEGFCLEGEEVFGFEYCGGAQRCCCEVEGSYGTNQTNLGQSGQVARTSGPGSQEVGEENYKKYLIWGGIILAVLIIIIVLIFVLRNYLEKKRRKEAESPIIDE